MPKNTDTNDAAAVENTEEAKDRITRALANEFDFGGGAPVTELPKSHRGLDLDKAHALRRAIEANGSATAFKDGAPVQFDSADDANKYGEAFRRLASAVEPVGMSARVKVWSPGNDGRFQFAVYYANARKGKGEKRGPRNAAQ